MPEPRSTAVFAMEVDYLVDAANAEIYRRNAFRITGLSVDCTAREINRRQDRLRMVQKFGGDGRDRTGPLPLTPPADEFAVRDATQRLQEPERRLVDEFFWFWPMELGKGRTDEAFQALARGDVKGASGLWRAHEMQSSESNVSRHNLAVLAHVLALDLELEMSRRSLRPEECANRDVLWSEAFRRWQILADHEGFWSRLSARIRELDHPSLTTGTGRRLRGKLPQALLLINARLAVKKCEEGNLPETNRQLDLIRSSGFEPRAIEEALEIAIAPVRERIQSLSKTAEADADAEPVHADRTTRRLLEQCQPLLMVLDALLPPGHVVRDAAHDEVALRTLGCQFSFGKKTENWKTSRELLESVLPVVASASARARIEENLRILKINETSGGDWVGEGYWDLPEPLIEVLERARDHAKGRRWAEAIEILTGLLAGRTKPLLTQKARPLVVKPLAFCLNLRAVDSINAALERVNSPRAIMRRIALARRVSFGSAQICMSCGSSIFGQFFRLKTDEGPTVICLKCNAEDDREIEERKANTRSALAKAGLDLLLSLDLDPNDASAQGNLVKTRGIANDLGVSFGSPRLLAMELGIETVEGMIKALVDENPDVRIAAARGLAKLGTRAKQAVPALARAARKDRTRPARSAANEALKSIDPAAHREVVRAVRRRFGIMAGAGVSLLAALMILRAYLLVVRGHEPGTVRWLNQHGLLSQGAAIETLVGSLKHPSARADAVGQELARVDNDGKLATRQLLVALESSDAIWRRLAVQALVSVPGWPRKEALQEAVPKIAKLLKSNRDEPVREAAVRALGAAKQDAVSALSEIIVALCDDASGVRNAAKISLPSIDAHWEISNAARAALPGLMENLSHSVSGVRETAMWALDTIQPRWRETPESEEALKALRRQLESEPHVFQRLLPLADALLRFGEPRDEKITAELVAAWRTNSLPRDQVQPVLDRLKPGWALGLEKGNEDYARLLSNQLNSVFGKSAAEYASLTTQGQSRRKPIGHGILPVSKNDKTVDPLFSKIEARFRATSPEEVRTIVWLYWVEVDRGFYSDGTAGKRVDCHVTVIDAATRTILASESFFGSDPPGTKSGPGGRTGDRPTEEVITYLNSLGEKKK